MTNIHPVRYFSASTDTIEYLIDEWAEERDTRRTLEKAAALIAEAEGDIFEERVCDDCGETVRGTGSKDANERLREHRDAIHR